MMMHIFLVLCFMMTHQAEAAHALVEAQGISRPGILSEKVSLRSGDAHQLRLRTAWIRKRATQFRALIGTGPFIVPMWHLYLFSISSSLLVTILQPDVLVLALRASHAVLLSLIS